MSDQKIIILTETGDVHSIETQLFTSLNVMKKINTLILNQYWFAGS